MGVKKPLERSLARALGVDLFLFYTSQNSPKAKAAIENAEHKSASGWGGFRKAANKLIRPGTRLKVVNKTIARLKFLFEISNDAKSDVADSSNAWR